MNNKPTTHVNPHGGSFWNIAGSALMLLAVSATNLSATSNYVYHEASTNNPGCGTDNYRSVLVPAANQALTIAFKAEYSTYHDQARVYYTTDGSMPAGAFGTGSGTTQVLVGTFSCTFNSGGIVDVVTASIPGQPGGTTVKYIVSAWHSGGGDEIFGNGCGNCGSPNNASALATVFSYTVPQPGAGLSFDGVDDFVSVPDVSTLDLGASLTLEAWVKPESFSVYNIIIDKRETADASANYGLTLTNGRPMFYFWNGGNLRFHIATNAIALNNFTHLAATYDGAAVRIYVNGAQVYAQAETEVTITNNQPLNIGRNPHSLQYFDGDIDEVRIWNTARTCDEISQLRNCELVGNETGLVAYYKFNQGLANDDNSGMTTLTDAAGGDNNGTLTNFALTGSTSNWVAPGGVTTGTSCPALVPVAFSACPTGETVNTVTGTCAAPASYTATANADITYLFTGATTGSGAGTGSGSTFNRGTTTVTLTATNACASTATCQFSVQVSDAEAPAITCPATANLNTNNNLCTSTASIGTASATDNCTITLNNALHFDGGNDYAAATVPGTFLGSNPLTVEFWAKNNSAFAFPMDLGFTWQVQFGNGTFYLSGFGLGAFNTGATVSNSGTVWEHFALTYDGAGTWKAYKNGLPTPTPSCTMAACFNNYSSTLTNPTLRMGTGNNNYFYAGGLDEVRIWSVERTQSQIAANLYNELGGMETGLNAYYKFNQGTAGGNNTSITAATATTGNNAPLNNLNLNGATSNFIAGPSIQAIVTNDAPAALPKGTTTVTWMATDGSGNTNSCQQTVNVTDNQIPVLTAPSNQSVNVTPGTCTGDHTIADPISDNCTGSTWSATFSGNALGNPTDISNIADGTGSGPITFQKGTTTVTLSGVDAASNAATTKTFTVTVVDNEVPTISGCSATNQNFNVVPGACAHDYSIPGPTTLTDNCPGTLTWNATFSGNPNGNPTNLTGQTIGVASADISFTRGVTTVTLSASDISGNTSTANCTFTVTVNDDEAPDITCAADVTINTTTGLCTGTTTLTAPTVSDDCTGIGSPTNNAPATYAKGSTTVTWTVADASGNTSSCAQTVTVVDNELPVLTAPSNQNLSATAGGCTQTYTIADPISDNCTGSTWSATFSGNALGNPTDISNIADGTGSAAITFQKGTTTVTLTGVDASGNTAVTKAFTVTVADNEVPIVNACFGTNIAAFGQATGNSITQGANSVYQSFTAPQTGVITSIQIQLGGGASGLTLQVGSGTACGGTVLGSKSFNGVSGFQTITFDTPIPVTGGVQYNFGILGNHTAGWATTGSYAGGQFYYNGCPGSPAFPSSDLVFTINMNYVPPISLTVAPGTCAQNYSIPAPTISDNCTGPLTWNATFSGNPNGNPSNLTGLADGVPTSALSFSKGATNVVLNAVDLAGNISTTACPFTVTVIDDEAPGITCADDVTINTTTGLCTGTTTLTEPTATDNCLSGAGNALHFDGSNDLISASDLLASPPTQFTVEFWLNPASLSNFNQEISIGSAGSGHWAGFTFHTTSDGSVYVGTDIGSRMTPSDIPANTLTVNSWQHFAYTFGGGTGRFYKNGVLIATKAHNTPANFSFLRIASGCCHPIHGSMDELRIWNVQRTQAEIQANLSSELSGSESNLVAYYNFNQGNAGGSNTGLTTLIDLATNIGGANNGTLTGFALSGSTSNWVTGQTFNNYTLSNNAPATYAKGSNTVTWTVADASGNTASCAQTVTVVDNELPVLTAPSNQTLSAAAGACSQNYTIADPISDNCTGSTWSASFSGNANGNPDGISNINDGSGSGAVTFQKGTTTVTLSGVDATSNAAATVMFTVTVTDDERPTISGCTTNQTLSTATGTCAQNYSIPAPALADNCGGPLTWNAAFSGNSNGNPTNLTAQMDGAASADVPFQKGTTLVTLSATDAVGNTSTVTCSFTVTVNDDEEPGITCADDVTINTTTGLCTGTTTLTAPTVSDNCPMNFAGNALDFDGSNDYISFPSNVVATATSFTYEAWVNVRAHQGWARILDFGNSAGVNMFLTTYGAAGVGRPRFVINIGAGEQVLDGPSALSLNTWTHIAVTQTGNTATMFINGVQVSQNTAFSYHPSSLGATTNNWIGRSQYADLYFNGKLDDIRLWNVARTPAQIAASMNSELVGNETGLVAYYKLNQGTPSGTNTGINTATAVVGPTGALNNFALTGATSNWVAGNVSNTIGSPTNNAPATYAKGSNTVTWTVADASGNTSSCAQMVTVVDNELPTTTGCPSNENLFTKINSCTQDYSIPAPTISDNCTGPFTWHAAFSGNTNGNPTDLTGQTDGVASGNISFQKGTTTVTLSSTDVSGNVSTANCSFTITVTDNVPPVVPTLSQINAICASTPTAPTTTDNCAGTVTGTTGTTFPITALGITTITWTFDDGNGNTSTATQTVSLVCDTDQDGYNPPEDCDDSNPDINPGILEDCGLVGVMGVDDDCDGTTDEDLTNPVAVCQPLAVALNAAGMVVLGDSDMDNGSSDNCVASGNLTFATSPNSFDCDDAGPNTVTLTVSDPSGNSSACTAVVTVIDVLNYTETPGIRTASDGAAGDKFGWGLGLDGGVMIVGAPDDKIGTQNKRGSAYVFLQNLPSADLWGQLKQLKSSDGIAVDYFGNAISVHGSTAVIGSHGSNVGALTDAGSVYVFEQNHPTLNNWGERKRISAPDATAYAYFGSAVSLLGERAVIGASKHKQGSNSAQGAAYIFEKNTGGANNWGNVKKLIATDGAPNNFFGNSATQIGDLVLVGANGNLNNRGAAYLFGKNTGGSGNWGQAQKLTASDAAVGDGFGTSVSMTSDYALIGAPNKATYSGAAYIFKNNAGTWSQLKKITVADGAINDRLGTSVELEGDYAYISAVRASGNAGAVYVFHKNVGGPDNWGQIGKYTATNGASGDQIGYSLGVSGEMLVFGANLDDIAAKADQGSVYVFRGEDCGEMSKPEGIVPAQSRGLAVSPSVQCTPNPFTDELSITVSAFGATHLTVTDAAGRLMAEADLPAGNVRFDLKTNEFRAGIYFVQVSSEAGVRVVPVALVR